MIPMSKNDLVSGDVHYLVGSPDVLSLPLSVYADDACGFLSDLSLVLLKNPAVREYPDVASFAYWCRKGNLAKRKAASAQSSIPLEARVGRGLAFHVAPSNIPVNFAFSFAFSLLAGNANIVRVPSKPFTQTTLICESIDGLLNRFPQIKQRTAFVTYPANDEITADFSKMADVRVLWGGDKTISRIACLPHKPHCKDILFSDRYSIVLIDALAVSRATDEQIESLAALFYNDTYLMDQNACSSPQMVFWLNASDNAKARFWQAVRRYAESHYILQGAVVVDKYMQLCENIIDGIIDEAESFDSLLTLVDIKELPEDISRLRGVGGLFYQHSIERIEDIAPVVTERYQTLLYYGFDAVDLRRFVVSAHLRGIDRIVPVGSAMDIDIIWDGCDLISDLSRVIDVR